MPGIYHEDPERYFCAVYIKGERPIQSDLKICPRTFREFKLIGGRVGGALSSVRGFLGLEKEADVDYRHENRNRGPYYQHPKFESVFSRCGPFVSFFFVAYWWHGIYSYAQGRLRPVPK